MKKMNLLVNLDRVRSIRVISPKTVVLTDGVEQIESIVTAIINAGYTGLITESHQTANGQYYQVINIDVGTIEGQFISLLQLIDPPYWPSPEKAVLIIRNAYEADEGDQP